MLLPAQHALRGVSATLVAGALLTSLSANRRALLSLRLANLRFVRPSRNVIAIAVFVGVFRFINRFQHEKEPPKRDRAETKPQVSTTALVTAAVLSIVGLKPENRAPLLSLLTTHAVSVWFEKLLVKHPELSVLKPLDLVVFLLSNGWIMYSGFFHPESYEPSHLKLIKKYSLTPEPVAMFLQDQYKQGLNPSTCAIRHGNRACAEYACSTFLWQSIAMALRIYCPVHIVTWLLALRRKSEREKPLHVRVQQLVKRIVRSAMYFVGFVFIGWTMSCYTNVMGARSVAWRKFQFFLCGSLPSASICFEAKSRRRPIGVILSSYSFVSMGTVLSQQKGWEWLQHSSGKARTLVDVIVAAIAVGYTFEDLIESNGLVQRVLLGQTIKNADLYTKRTHVGRRHNDLKV